MLPYMSTVSIHEAKAKLSSLIEEALSGDEVIIKRRSTPLVKIVPLERIAAGRRIGTAKGLVRIAEDFDAIPEGFEDYVD
jgi:prevent-host-death family protein